MPPPQWRLGFKNTIGLFQVGCSHFIIPAFMIAFAHSIVDLAQIQIRLTIECIDVYGLLEGFQGNVIITLCKESITNKIVQLCRLMIL
jgi:hypothetical protein